ncbi:MAG: putative glycoside hydrolase, partial [Acidimicrobiales bacterium]
TIVTQYFDLTWVGNYIQPSAGVPWMPAPWSYVNERENFFSHSSPSASPSTRIANPIFGYSPQGAERTQDPTGTPLEFLANPYDLNARQPGNLNHWINYFAAQSRSLIAQSGMDGLMMDEVCQPYVPYPFRHDRHGSTPENWHMALERDLKFIRGQLGPDMVMFYNGINDDIILQPRDLSSPYPFSRPAKLNFLNWCDGALMEFFVTSYLGPPVWPQGMWEEILDACMAIAARGVLLAGAPSGVEDPVIRSFVLASFHLVKGDRSYMSHGGFDWYPEWTVQMGAPLQTAKHIQKYLVLPGVAAPGIASASGVVYARGFEEGVALANPSAAASTVTLARPGYLVVPQGGGSIGADGVLPAGQVGYQLVEQVSLPSQSGALVLSRVGHRGLRGS